jgi:serine/threonine protein kinase
MGVVFRAHDPLLNRTVAIKVLRPSTDDAASRSRLGREAQALAKLKHANIVQVFAIAETTTGLPYLVMEFVPGINLAEHIHQHGRLNPTQAARLVANIAAGLQLAHDAGLIHRDVKPANIVLPGELANKSESVFDHAKLTDFGLARATESTATASTLLAGTPAYMSPEQVRDPGRIDARADVYSLGATLYECLTGDAPFRGSTAMVLRQVLDDEPAPPRRMNEAVPRDLQVICLKAMAKEPGRRYSSAADFAADLQRYLSGEPIHARPVGMVERSMRGHAASRCRPRSSPLWRWPSPSAARESFGNGALPSLAPTMPRTTCAKLPRPSINSLPASAKINSSICRASNHCANSCWKTRWSSISDY